LGHFRGMNRRDLRRCLSIVHEKGTKERPVAREGEQENCPSAATPCASPQARASWPRPSVSRQLLRTLVIARRRRYPHSALQPLTPRNSLACANTQADNKSSGDSEALRLFAQVGYYNTRNSLIVATRYASARIMLASLSRQTAGALSHTLRRDEPASVRRARWRGLGAYLRRLPWELRVRLTPGDQRR